MTGGASSTLPSLPGKVELAPPEKYRGLGCLAGYYGHKVQWVRSSEQLVKKGALIDQEFSNLPQSKVAVPTATVSFNKVKVGRFLGGFGYG